MSLPSQAGAFFDIDGTLLPWPSLEWRFIAYLASRDILGSISAIRSAGIALKNMMRGAPLATGNRRYLAGLAVTLVNEWLADLSRPLPVFSDGLRRLDWHTAQGHHIVLISGTLAPLARAFARQIGLEVGIRAAELETDLRMGGEDRETNFTVWTGQLAAEWPNAHTKAKIVRRIAIEHQLDLARSFAYGNSASDAPMLASVGFACAVNPSLQLRRLAAERRWLIEYWKLRATSEVAHAPYHSTTVGIGGHQ
jgi:HAD superfamily phosphoserine phosphatase-like hydrolase